MKIRQVLGDRVLIRQDPLSTKKSDGGILMPETRQEDIYSGIVVMVGNGERRNGELCRPTVKEHQRVIYSRFAGVKVDGGDYAILPSKDILAIAEREE